VKEEEEEEEEEEDDDDDGVSNLSTCTRFHRYFHTSKYESWRMPRKKKYLCRRRMYRHRENPSGYGGKKLLCYENKAVSGISLLRACVPVYGGTLTVLAQFTIHVKYGGERAAASKAWPAFHFYMHDVQAD
jgi:hypothetical protein